jgi:hypothetical protein
MPYGLEQLNTGKNLGVFLGMSVFQGADTKKFSWYVGFHR